jgi:hypothetical protein
LYNYLVAGASVEAAAVAPACSLAFMQLFISDLLFLSFSSSLQAERAALRSSFVGFAKAVSEARESTININVFFMDIPYIVALNEQVVFMMNSHMRELRIDLKEIKIY